MNQHSSHVSTFLLFGDFFVVVGFSFSRTKVGRRARRCAVHKAVASKLFMFDSEKTPERRLKGVARFFFICTLKTRKRDCRS